MTEVKKIATRASYGSALVELGKKYDNLVVLDADLANATQTYTGEFVSGLMNGSDNLVNSSNVAAVLSGLQALNNIDQSVFTGPSAKAYATGTQAIPANDKGVAETMKALNNLMNLLK